MMVYVHVVILFFLISCNTDWQPFTCHCRSEYVLFQPADWVCKRLLLVQTAIQRTGLVQDRLLNFSQHIFSSVVCVFCSYYLKPMQLFNWALEPAEDEILDKLYDLGYKDAAVWAEQNSTEFIAKNVQPLAID